MPFDRGVEWDRVNNLFAPVIMTMLNNRFIKKAGDTVTGAIVFANTVTAQAAVTLQNTLTVAGTATFQALAKVSPAAASAVFQLDSPLANFSELGWLKAGAYKFSATVEALGGPWQLRRFNIGGAWVDSPLSVDWNTGIVDHVDGATVLAPALTDSSTRVPTTAWVRSHNAPAVSGITSLAGTGDVYLVGKAIAAGELTTNARYRITFMMNKTATLANTTITVRFGAAGTTADTLIAQLVLTGTAATDSAIVTCEVAIATINPATGTVIAFISALRGATATTGFHNNAGGSTGASVATLDTTAARTLGVSVQASVGGVVSVFSTVIQKVAA